MGEVSYLSPQEEDWILPGGENNREPANSLSFAGTSQSPTFRPLLACTPPPTASPNCSLRRDRVNPWENQTEEPAQGAPRGGALPPVEGNLDQIKGF